MEQSDITYTSELIPHLFTSKKLFVAKRCGINSSSASSSATRRTRTILSEAKYLAKD